MKPKVILYICMFQNGVVAGWQFVNVINNPTPAGRALSLAFLLISIMISSICCCAANSLEEVKKS
jgi:hypothetical protein